MVMWGYCQYHHHHYDNIDNSPHHHFLYGEEGPLSTKSEEGEGVIERDMERGREGGGRERACARGKESVRAR